MCARGGCGVCACVRAPGAWARRARMMRIPRPVRSFCPLRMCTPRASECAFLWRRARGDGCPPPLAATADMWAKWGLWGTVGCGAYLVKCFAEEMNGEHAHTDRQYSHTHRRNKPYAWEYANCDRCDGARATFLAFSHLPLQVRRRVPEGGGGGAPREGGRSEGGGARGEGCGASGGGALMRRARMRRWLAFEICAAPRQ